jgi:hypothetical protein
LNGYYHPYKIYLWCGSIRNDNSQDFKLYANTAPLSIGATEDLVASFISDGTNNCDIDVLLEMYEGYSLKVESDVSATISLAPALRVSVDGGQNYIGASNYYDTGGNVQAIRFFSGTVTTPRKVKATLDLSPTNIPDSLFFALGASMAIDDSGNIYEEVTAGSYDTTSSGVASNAPVNSIRILTTSFGALQAGFRISLYGRKKRG